MIKKALFAALFLTATVFGVSAQKIQGDISPLKGQKEVNIVLDFKGTLVNGKAESKYIAEETKDKKEDEKTQWLSEWNEKLRADALSMVIRDINNETGKKLFSVGEFKNAEYTIIVNVKEITTGYFAGVFARPSAVNAEIHIVKTGTTTPIATIELKKCSSSISSTIPYFVTRIAMSFGELGEDFGELMCKKLK